MSFTLLDIHTPNNQPSVIGHGLKRGSPTGSPIFGHLTPDKL
ncbi:hypothetical protein [Lyngbya sp. CCY1209]|nr:hypothetical protein [Lyngbya sp. CCY1209]